jgi:hypothetical protein
LVWSCWRLYCVSPEGMTVGTVVPIRNAARPGEGSVCSVSELITVPVDAFDVSINGACPVTVMVSVTVPSSSTTSSVRNCCVPTRIAVRW